jgi:hypothetical protein
MRSDPGSLADHRDIGIADSPAAFAQQLPAMAQETAAVGALPLRIRWREMRADVA